MREPRSMGKILLVALAAVAGVFVIRDTVSRPIIVVPIRWPPPPPPPSSRSAWSLESTGGNVTCEPERRTCSVEGAGSLHKRFQPWTRLRNAAFVLEGGRGSITLTPAGSALRVQSDVPLTQTGRVLSVQDGVSAVRMDWKYGFDTNRSDGLGDSGYKFY